MGLEAGQPLEVIYRAKRLIEINPEDSDANDALRFLAFKRIRSQADQSFIYDLLLDEQFGLELVHAGGLVERRKGESICEYNDAGTTMFLILKGKIGVFFPTSTRSIQSSSPPPDLIMFPGELAGELAFALHRRRTATLRSLEDTALLAFSYVELTRAVSEAKVRTQLEDTLNRKMLSRIIENVWHTAAFFRTSTMSSALAGLTAPWLTLLSFSEMTTVDWSSRAISFTDAESKVEGLSVLVRGQMQVKDTGCILDGQDYPVLWANFPNELVHWPNSCSLLDEVRVLSIRREGFSKLGAEAYHEIVQRVRQSLSAHRMGGGAKMDGVTKIVGYNEATRKLDVVFVHGLGGDAYSSWHPKDQPDKFWPQWLGEDFPQVGVWSLGYAASVSKWKEESMPLADRGNNVLERLANDSLGERPLVFITHSMGGIVVKQFLRHADSFGVPRWEAIAKQSRGIAFIATPHSGANLVNFAEFVRAVLRTNEQVEELKQHDPRLRELHGWFLNYQSKHKVICRTYCEKRQVRPEILGLKLPRGILVVDETSAEPNIPGERAIPLDEDHISICKPLNREADLYRSISRFIQECLRAADNP